jgi:hypothetical protein
LSPKYTKKLPTLGQVFFDVLLDRRDGIRPLLF